MRLREATPADGALLVDFFVRTPMAAGTTFVLDRGPDFFALLALRGSSRTFVLFDNDRLAGCATALWRTVRDGGRDLVHGEVVDLRVADFARGTRAAFRLLGAVHEAFVAACVSWVSCLIASENHIASTLVAGRAGLPPLALRRRYVSAHVLACRPLWRVDPHCAVSLACASDGPVIDELLAGSAAARAMANTSSLEWPDPTGRSTAWIARASTGRPLGVLLLWDGDSVRRIRVTHYRRNDVPLRLFARAAHVLSAGVALPHEGEVLRTWASRAFVVAENDPTVARALLGAAMHAAVQTERHVVQVNLDARDALVGLLPRFPRSTFSSCVYGGPFGAALPHDFHEFTGDHADIALA